MPHGIPYTKQSMEGIFMRYFYIVLVVAIVLLLVAVIIALCVKWRKYRAMRKVQLLSQEEKEERLNHALASFGFAYDEENDAICSGMYPWQRETGYCKAYDEGAASMYMIFDCEPIYFDYGGARYLLELWKGQYGCTTGAEIGFYVNREEDREKAPDRLFYECVSDEERIPMRFALYRNGEKILERGEVHWWLTGFQVGMYSEPEDLVMEIGLAFPNAMLCSAFLEGLLRAGYQRKDIYMEQYRVYFRFDRPHSEQPDSCGQCCRNRIQRRNRKNCNLYCKVTEGLENTPDKINYIGYCFPLLYKIVIRLGMKNNKRKLGKYKKRMYR